MNLSYNMKRYHFLYPLLAILLLQFISMDCLFAQCVNFGNIEFINPSFEGPTGAHIAPPQWTTCYYTPDTQPGIWDVADTASEGSTFVGLVFGGNMWEEGISQELISPLQNGVEYGFRVDLSATLASGGGINPANHGILEVWGSDTICTKTELLWSSPLIDHVGWQTYDVTFIPNQDHNFIYFLNNGQQMGYLLMDNLSNHEPDTTVIGIVSHQDSSIVDCQVEVHGFVDESFIDSLVLQGGFVGSPLTIVVTDSVWMTTVSYLTGGFESVTATAYYTDSLHNPSVCSSADVLLHVQSPVAHFTSLPTCAKVPVSLADSSMAFGNNSIVSWVWDFGDGSTSNVQNPQHDYTAHGTYMVTLHATSSDGCFDLASQNITVLGLPDADFTFTEVCLGGTTNFHDLSLPLGAPIATHHWNLGEGNTSQLPDPIHTYASAGSYIVTLVVSDTNSCTDTLTQVVEVFQCSPVQEVDDHSIVIFPNPAIDRIFIQSMKEKLLKIELFESSGKLVRTYLPSADPYATEIIANQLTSGIYYLRLTTADDGSLYHRMVIY
ncbi:MAG: PKD domain-containing protein [Flavobacteriales bacterium]|nr:PKD domain-containing protein [Flavobacteriales bacterium]